jgi:purine-cytosine permease-like protein
MIDHRYLQESDTPEPVPTWEVVFTCIVLAIMFGVLMMDRVGTDSVMLTALTAFYVSGIITVKEGTKQTDFLIKCHKLCTQTTQTILLPASIQLSPGSAVKDYSRFSCCLSWRKDSTKRVHSTGMSPNYWAGPRRCREPSFESWCPLQ